jgi:hypothetical protein
VVIRVHLPIDALINYWSFCRDIARAIRPAGEQGLEGIDCITGKLLRAESPRVLPLLNDQWPIPAGSQLLLTSNDGRTLGQLRRNLSPGTEHVALDLPLEEPPKIIVTEFSLPSALEEQDRREIEQLLPRLPPLRYPIFDEEAKEFLKAYFALCKRPEWEPTLVTPATIERWKVEQDGIFDLHRRALQDDFSKKILFAVDDYSVPVKHLSAGSRIPRAYAIEYLNRCGIPYEDADDQNSVSGQHLTASRPDADAHISAELLDNRPPTQVPVAVNAAKATTTPASLQDADETEPPAAGNKRGRPDGLPTPSMAIAFDGFGDWNKDEWARYLTEAKWTKVAMTRPGRPGKGNPALWDPVKLALAAQKRRGISLHQYTKAFRNIASLRPWLEEWEEYMENERNYRD